MNFFNPYYYSLPQMAAPRLGALGRIASSARGLNIGSIVNGTQKTLNIINQAIPIIKEASPMMRNAKTMFKIANEFKKVDAPAPSKNINAVNSATEKQTNNEQVVSESGPTFFL